MGRASSPFPAHFDQFTLPPRGPALCRLAPTSQYASRRLPGNGPQQPCREVLELRGAAAPTWTCPTYVPVTGGTVSKPRRRRCCALHTERYAKSKGRSSGRAGLPEAGEGDGFRLPQPRSPAWASMPATSSFPSAPFLLDLLQSPENNCCRPPFDTR